MTQKRIQRSRKKGWRMPQNTVYVGRPTKWGNPFNVSKLGRPYAVHLFRQYLLETRWVEDPSRRLFNQLHELRGKNLACWCKLGEPCHADVLLEIANAPEGGAQ